MKEQETQLATDSALAAELGISRQAISKHRKQGQCPKGRSVSAWRQFLAVSPQSLDLKGQFSREKLIHIQLENQRMKREEEVARGELVKFEEVVELVSREVLSPLSQSLIDAAATGKADKTWVAETMKRIADGVRSPIL